MSSIQQGIQAAHAQTEMALKYSSSKPEDKASELWKDWAKNYKTMICLNAGYLERLYELRSLLEDKTNPYPWSYFEEAIQALGGILTNVAIILPEKIYKTAELIRSGEYIVHGISSNNGIYYHTYNPKIIGKYAPGANPITVLTAFEVELINFLNTCSLTN
jgi:hypothetical protein